MAAISGGLRGRPGWAALVCAAAVAVLSCAGLLLAAPAQAAVATDAEDAAQVATAAGYRTGVAVLDLETGTYTGAGEDTATFASESVVKVLIATELLLTGKMTGDTETTAYEMITQSDDEDADALYGLAGGDDVVTLVAEHYGIADLGSPPDRAGWWGNTHLTAKGLVQLYAAVAQDDTVGPWLMNAMAHATEYGSDGTYQFFGLPSATTGAAVKQGWGADGDDAPNAVFNSTGYVDDGRYAVAILTDGPSSTYGSAISAVVTAQAKALMPDGAIEQPAASAAPATASPTAAAPATATASSAVGASGGGVSASGGPVAVLRRHGVATGIGAGLLVLGAVVGLAAVRHRGGRVRGRSPGGAGS
jgi:hypothetical protein